MRCGVPPSRSSWLWRRSQGSTIRDRAEEQRKATYAAGLVQSLLNADTAQVPAIVAEMSEYRHWTDPLLT